MIDCTGYRVRRDKIFVNGNVTLRHNARLHHIYLGSAFKGWRVVMLVAGLEVRVLSLDACSCGGSSSARSTTSPSAEPTGWCLRGLATSVSDVSRHHGVRPLGFEPTRLDTRPRLRGAWI